jgi:hypothetical protein
LSELLSELRLCSRQYSQKQLLVQRRIQKHRGGHDGDVFYLFLQKQKIGAELHIYLEEGTYHKRLFRGPNTNDMKK